MADRAQSAYAPRSSARIEGDGPVEAEDRSNVPGDVSYRTWQEERTAYGGYS